MLTLRSSLVLAVLLVAPAALALTRESGVRVVDGDTIDLNGQKVRLFGIDAPEKTQSCDRHGQSWACGAWSVGMLERAIGSAAVVCTAQDTDRYGRLVATCTADGVDLARAQVQAGAAQAYARFSRQYLADEAAAKAAGLGLWAGRMVTPEAHRHNAAPPAQTAPAACNIKGNISASGHIYHRPGQRDYDATRINPAKGEGWFCSADEAEAAGFRPARR